MLTFRINSLDIAACAGDSRRVCWMLYPFPLPPELIGEAARVYGVSIAVVTGMDWDNDLTPWKATGVPEGSPDFQGKAATFLETLTSSVMPQVEKALGVEADAERTLVGVSLSGLFTLWQWMVSDVFTDIISLSGSFWYEGFVSWIESVPVPLRKGHAYFLLGNREARSPVPQFRSVQADTEEIVAYLKAHGINGSFELVPGNHYQHAEERLRHALDRMFGPQGGR